MDIELQKYIKPKEFTFCSKCGKICKHTDKDFICIGCRKELPDYETRLSIQCEKLVSTIYKEYREELAKIRQMIENGTLVI